MQSLLVSSRKGLIELIKNSKGKFQTHKIHFKAEPISNFHQDSRNGYWYAAIDHGHWGSKLHVSKDQGSSWTEIEVPKYPEGEEVKDGVPAVLRYIWSFANGNSNGNHEGVLIGTEPGGLFMGNHDNSEFQLNQGLWNHPSRKEQWFGGGRDHPGIHSIVIDQEDADRIFVGISCAGVFETKNGGKDWNPMNKGLKAEFLPDPESEVGQDPHLLVQSSVDSDLMWQQNHCGIFVSEDRSETWNEVSDKDGIANFGFTIGVSNQYRDTAWVIPAISDQERIACGYKLNVCRTENLGNNWETLSNGLPQEYSFDLVYRHALAVKDDSLVFGTTTGNLFISEDGGDHWDVITNYYPMIYAVNLIEA